MENCYCISLTFILNLLLCSLDPYHLSSQLEGQQTLEKLWRAALNHLLNKSTNIFRLHQNIDRYPNSPTAVRACFALSWDRPRKLPIQMLHLSWNAIRNIHWTSWLYDTQGIFSHDIRSLVCYFHLLALLQNKHVLGDLQVNIRHDKVQDLPTGTKTDDTPPFICGLLSHCVDALN